MVRVPQRLRKPLVIGLPLVLLTSGAVGVFLGFDGSGGGQAAANRAQLKHACAGLLPYEELSGFVPDGVEGEVSQYGTVLEPDEESRSLVNCAVTWPGHGSVRVRAAALVSPMPMSVKLEDIVAAGEDGEGSYEVPGLTGRVDEDGRAWIVAECAGGLDGQVRDVSAMYVTADVDLPVPGKGKQAKHLVDFTTAVQVANGITEAQNCGGTPLAKPTRLIDTYEAEVTADPDGSNIRTVRIDEPGLGVKKCRGLGKRAGFAGNWTASGDLQDSRLLSVCTATVRDREDPAEIDPSLEYDAIDASAASWAGALGWAALDQYDRTGDSSVFQAGRRTKVVPESEPTELALWARSKCAAGSTYHRVTVGMEDADYSERTLSDAERNEYSRNARKLLDSYLTDPDGWPRQQRCHGTEILGEVEGWR
ncbi:hypothetical protein EJ357_33655 [Streptomyces cyaneochromogenes]|uniref:Uncharacterized protein n=1 Tax=Streptomyces cyaneochromogenes TaxID=2496836 RepID=A0A3Q9EWZ4_9ACTN|nr:hypothetical protein [Streptomyces cyaneochromogenes]AZQ37799.1 hypothetical protein EJ357_33655 [Streptomyces cyaneochromogenes]